MAVDVTLWLPIVVIAALLAAMFTADSTDQHTPSPLAKLRYGAAKTLASVVFVAVGVARLPLHTAAGVAMLVGLCLSLVGDVLLIDKSKRLAFLAGLASFLCAHAAYALAFAFVGLDPRATTAGAVAMLALGAPIARWLLPHVTGAMRGPVIAYVVTITAMVALAVGAGARWTLILGAVFFYISDIGVARERFVTKDRWNGLVGLPLYYAAQLLLIDGLAAAS